VDDTGLVKAAALSTLFGQARLQQGGVCAIRVSSGMAAYVRAPPLDVAAALWNAPQDLDTHFPALRTKYLAEMQVSATVMI
jgi:hypothetical protein